jgi:nanoRNase/pAp phosphatase (c-di-AMP/oligoRNAs hydrolase)
LKVVLVGFGPVGRRVARMLRDRDVEVLFVEEDPSRASEARRDGHECAVGLVLDRDVLGMVGDADAFVLMDLDPLRVDKLARSLRRRHPSARVISPDVQLRELPHLGGPDDGRPAEGPPPSAAAVGPDVRLGLQAVAEAVVSSVEDHMARRSAERLEQVLRGGPADAEVAVFTHDDPDPDAMASGMAVLRICESLGLGARLYHGGSLLRLENRFFARLLEVPLSTVTREEAAALVERAGRVVLVDAGRPGEHNALPRGSVPNVVLDHHSTNREALTADYCDVRPHVGSASTLLTLYLQGLGIAPGGTLATALLYGLRTDTDHLRRNAFPADARVSVYLSGLADQDLMDMLERPPRSAEVMDAIGRALLDRLRAGDHVFTWVGELASRDDLSQVADFLMQEDDVAAVFVFGRVGDTIHLSARAVEGGPHVGEVARRALEGVGSGGGHPTMGGGSVTMRMGPDMDVDGFVRNDLYEAFAEAAGVGAALDTARTRVRATRGGG